MRAHAHLDARRREPFLLDEPYRSIARDAIRLRLSYLPYVYTLFAEAAATGAPVMRPLWMEFPEDTTAFAEQTSFLLGADLLVTPVTKPDAATAAVRFPGPAAWVDTHAWSEVGNFAGAPFPS